MHFGATLLIMVLEIQWNFQINVVSAGKLFLFHIWWNHKQIWHAWYTWVTSKCLRTVGSEWPDKCDKIGFAAWPGVGEFFSCGHLPQVNSLWPSDVIWRQGSRSTLAQVMACCLTAPSHYLNQCWLMITEVLWHSPDSNFTENAWDIYHWNEFEIY